VRHFSYEDNESRLFTLQANFFCRIRYFKNGLKSWSGFQLHAPVSVTLIGLEHFPLDCPGELCIPTLFSVRNGIMHLDPECAQYKRILGGGAYELNKTGNPLP
jgi:hypothetical protein